MKIKFQSSTKLTKPQRDKLEHQLVLVLARFGDRIGVVSVQLSDAANLPGYKQCRLEVGLRPKSVSAEHSDINIFLAVEHAANRVARSVLRTIENASFARR